MLAPSCRLPADGRRDALSRGAHGGRGFDRDLHGAILPPGSLREGYVGSAAPAARRAGPAPGTRRWRSPAWRRSPRACPPPTISPPRAPPSGPRSMIQSAVLMTSRLCSMTITVLPLSTSRCSTCEQLLHVGEVQAGGRLVQQVDRLAGGAPRQLGGELDALRLAAAQRGRRLAEPDVAEADVHQRLQLGADLRAPPGRPRSASSTVISSTSAMEWPR